MRTVSIASALLLCMGGGAVVAQALNGVPTATQRFDNPAVDVSTRYANNPSLRIPLGLLGLLHPERNPLLYVTDEERFRDSFDALSAIAQLSRPFSYLLNPPVSPDRVVAELSADGVALTDGEGNSLVDDLSGRQATPYYTLYRTAPLLQFKLRREAVQFSSSLHAGGTGVRIRANSPLERLLDGKTVADDTELALRLNSTAAVGFEQAVTSYATFPAQREASSVVVAARLAFHYTAALAELGTSLGVSTSDGSTESELAGRVFYPGNGYSLGGRLDIGTLLLHRGWYWGIGAGSIVSRDIATGGVRLSDENRHETHGGPGVVPTLQSGYDTGSLIGVHFEGSIYPAPHARASAVFRPGPIALQLSYLFAEQEAASIGMRVPIGFGSLSATFRSERAVISDNALHSLQLAWQLRNGGTLWRDELVNGGGP